MIPLSYAEKGQENIIRKVNGNEEMKKRLEQLGFVPGSTITLLSDLSGNVIVKVKESRIAISSQMASRIMV